MDKEVSRRGFLERAAVATGLIAVVSTRGPAAPSRAAQGSWARESSALLTLAAMAAQIVPTTETPGAKDARVIDYIRDHIEGSAKMQERCEAGVKEVDAVSQEKYDTPFATLDTEKQQQILKAMEHSDFFRMVRELTVRGFYSSPVGQRTIAFPGHGQPHGYPEFHEPPKREGPPTPPRSREPAGRARLVVVRSELPMEDW